MLKNSENTNLLKLFNSLNKMEEYEVMFFNYKRDNAMSVVNFMKSIKYLKLRSDKDNLILKESSSLDISYNYDANNVYRVTINNLEEINNFLNLVHKRKNHVIFSILMTQFLNKDNVTLMDKVKDKKYIIDLDDYDIRVRKSKELPVNNKIINDLANLPLSSMNKIFFRYKQRVSLQLSKNDDINIDLTVVKSSNNVNELATSKKIYELEIDYSPASKISKKAFDVLISEMETLKKMLSESELIIRDDERKEILFEYKKLFFGNNTGFNNLYSMQPISAEVQHVIDKIPNKYCVTDKADGVKYQLFIFKGNVYLISNNMFIKKLDMKIKNLKTTILEGEFIHLSEERKYLFMVFDCLYYDGIDVKLESDFKKRYEFMQKACTDLKTDVFKFSEFKSKFSLKNMKDFYVNDLRKYFDHINKMVSKNKVNSIIFHPKYFIFPLGGSNSEVFQFIDLIWTSCTEDETVKCPYILDGAICQGLIQKYTRDKREQQFPTYKYKPPETNSIDVYVKFARNKELGGYLDIFDNSLPDKVENQNFRVVNFFVGDFIGNKEVPVPFMRAEDNDQGYFPIDRGQVRDVEGNLVQDKTVIEIIYTNDIAIPHKYRWSILRTRWDKTESVNKLGKKYGNFKDVAIKTWKSMKEAVTIEEIRNLSNPESFESQKNTLSSRINNTIVSSDRMQDVYYQKISNLCKEMRNFHNWLKSNIIYTYCSPESENKDGPLQRKSVLDIGCGRGGDVMKWFHARIKNYVGFDPDYEGIYSSIDGAVSRYNSRKKVFPQFYPATFFQADGGIPLNVKAQSERFSNLSNQNKKLIESTFKNDRKFDIISSQMAIHYLFGSKDSIGNLVNTIKTHLKKGGYVIYTLLDGERVDKILDGKSSYASFYTDDDGKKMKLFEIKKNYNKLESKPGVAIDIHMSWISQEDKFIQEYLISKDFMVKTMESAGCRLVDTDLFLNTYNINKEWFSDVIEYEENPKNKKFYQNAALFYKNKKIGSEQSRTWSRLFRYYIFTKV
jgi:SAM-dependent methyltransferase